MVLLMEEDAEVLMLMLMMRKERSQEGRRWYFNLVCSDQPRQITAKDFDSIG
jgi:hypothetical protein